MATDGNNDDIVFDNEGDNGGDAPSTHGRYWTVAIVDDDAGVHQGTEYALARIDILDRPLKFLHAYSTAGAIELLKNAPDVAVILLDVVMESDDAGLRLVKIIREELGIHEARIILRTGQPGYAPEMDVIRDYDINDYKTKSELSRNRLYTTLTAAIRSYQQIHTINANRRGLDMIIRASGKLMMHRGFNEFAAGLITQIAGLLSLPPEGVVCAHDHRDSGNQTLVIAAAGHFAPCINQPLSTLNKPEMADALNRALDQRCSHFDKQSTTLFFPAESGHDMVAYLETGVPLSETDRHLLEIFCSNISISLENVILFGQLHDYAFKDLLLGIPNQLAFLKVIDRAVIDEPKGKSIALIRIDNLRELIDSLGSEAGDALLAQVSQRLGKLDAAKEMVARVATDVFGTVGTGAAVSYEHLGAPFAEEFKVGNAAHRLTVSIGVMSLDRLVSSADGMAVTKKLSEAIASRASWSAFFAS